MAQKTKVLFLKSTENSVGPTIDYLRSRNFDVVETISLREFILAVSQGWPHFIFIDSAHPNKSAKLLPSMLSKTHFPFALYLDTSDAAQALLLQKTPVENKIFAPLSGPTLERFIVTMEKKQEAVQKSHIPEGLQEFEKMKKSLIQLSQILETDRDRLNLVQNSSHRLTSIESALRTAEPRTKIQLEVGPNKILKGMQKASPMGDLIGHGFLEVIKQFQSQIQATPAAPEEGHVFLFEEQGSFSYLVIYEPLGPAAGAQFLQMLSDQIQKHLSAKGFQFEIKKIVAPALTSSEVETWGYDNASVFLLVETEKKFFSLTLVPSPVLPTDEPEFPAFASFPTSNIQVSEKLPFNAYIYLPANKKMMVYTLKGRPLNEKQMESLTEKGFDKIYFTKDQLSDFQSELLAWTLRSKKSPPQA